MRPFVKDDAFPKGAEGVAAVWEKDFPKRRTGVEEKTDQPDGTDQPHVCMYVCRVICRQDCKQYLGRSLDR